MKKSLSTNFIEVLLDVLLTVSGFLLVMGVLYVLFGGKAIFTINIGISFIVYLIYVLILYNLRKIVCSTKLTPFCFDNVRRFKIIGYYMFSIAIFDVIVNYKRQAGIEIFATKYGSLKGSFFMYIVLACMALALAEIFKKAVEIKEENDSTV